MFHSSEISNLNRVCLCPLLKNNYGSFTWLYNMSNIHTAWYINLPITYFQYYSVMQGNGQSKIFVLFTISGADPEHFKGGVISR